MIDVQRVNGPECQDALRNMYQFLDKELPKSEVAHVQSHLDECIPCLEAFEFETELKAVIANKCQEAVPSHLYAKVQASLRQEIGENPGDGGIPAT